jgi:glycosyltransferase involved in cell wall biosynthesis
MQQNMRCYENGSAELYCLVQEFGAELLHANQFCYGAAEFGIPSLVTAHSDVLSWARACRSGNLQGSAWLRQYCTLVQKGIDGSDAVVAPTKWMLHALGENFHLPQRRLVIANGRYVPPMGARARVLRAVTAGRLWDDAKDVALLCRVRWPIPIVVAGDVECDGRSAEGFNGIELRKTLGENEMLRFFAESVIYICTSRYEPFGLAPLEAAMCGCAVLARRIEPLQEVWGNAAFYFDEEEELSELLRQLSKNPTELREAQRRSQERAGRFTRMAMMKAYRALYSEVMQMAKAS